MKNYEEYKATSIKLDKSKRFIKSFKDEGLDIHSSANIRRG